jgi:hypothetical protein
MKLKKKLQITNIFILNLLNNELTKHYLNLLMFIIIIIIIKLLSIYMHLFAFNGGIIGLRLYQFIGD